MTAADPTHARDILAEHYAYCEDRLKQDRRVEWLAALFAPADKRPFLHALGAFALDVEGIRAKVREPLAGELRLQWWTDAIEGEARGDVRGHPVAAALIDAAHRRHLPRTLLTGYLDCKRDELYGEPPSTWADFTQRADQAEGSLITLRAFVLTEGRDAVLTSAAQHAGRITAAWRAVADLAGEGPHAAAGLSADALMGAGIEPGALGARQIGEPLHRLLCGVNRYAEAERESLRSLRTRLEPEAAPAFLTVNIAAAVLRQSVRPGFDPFRMAATLPQWRSQWLLWRAARRHGIL